MCAGVSILRSISLFQVMGFRAYCSHFGYTTPSRLQCYMLHHSHFFLTEHRNVPTCMNHTRHSCVYLIYYFWHAPCPMSQNISYFNILQVSKSNLIITHIPYLPHFPLWSPILERVQFIRTPDTFVCTILSQSQRVLVWAQAQFNNIMSKLHRSQFLFGATKYFGFTIEAATLAQRSWMASQWTASTCGWAPRPRHQPRPSTSTRWRISVSEPKPSSRSVLLRRCPHVRAVELYVMPFVGMV